MSKTKKILIGVLSFFAIIIIVAYFIIRSISNSGIPDYDKNLSLKGLTDSVSVYRDAYAVPHIYAKNEKDLYRVVGYVTAQDRMWQMDLLRRVTLGRLSEIFGDDFVDTDLMLRSLQIPAKTKMILDSTSTEMKDYLDAYCDGVNQYIEQNIDNLPMEFKILGYKPEKWLPEYSINLVGYMAFDLTMPWEHEMLLYKISRKVDSLLFKEIMPNIKSQKVYAFPEYKNLVSCIDKNKSLLASADVIEEYGLNIFNGSNNWAVNGNKSETGQPILANDMHLGFSAPIIWFQMHQCVEGKLNVTGLVVPGQPLVVVGHNDSIAWGMTNVMIDDMDFYLEKINPNNPNEYEYMGKWLPLKRVKETINLKKGKSIEKELVFTHRGPIISDFKDIKDVKISMHWTGNEYSNELLSIFKLNHACNWKDFTDAVRTMNSISQNIAYADVKGNIGLYSSAGIPIRKNGDGSTVMPGWVDTYNWIGKVPFEQQPHTYNPACNYVSSANSRSVDSLYPYHISNWYAMPYRIQRIREMLTAKEKLSVKDFMSMQADIKSKQAEFYTPDVIANIEGRKLKPLENRAFEILKKWDYECKVDDIAPTIFETMFRLMIRNIFADEMGVETFAAFNKNRYLPLSAMDNIWRNHNSIWIDNINTKDIKENLSDIIYKSYKDAIDTLKNTIGKDETLWQWGKVHTLTIKHPLGKVNILNKIFNLNIGPISVPGSMQTVCPFAYPFSNPCKTTNGPSHRNIYSTANWDESYTVLPTGNSGIPSSKHYKDQSELFFKNEYHPDYFSKEKVETNAKYKMVFTPKQ